MKSKKITATLITAALILSNQTAVLAASVSESDWTAQTPVMAEEKVSPPSENPDTAGTDDAAEFENAAGTGDEAAAEDTDGTGDEAPAEDTDGTGDEAAAEDTDETGVEAAAEDTDTTGVEAAAEDTDTTGVEATTGTEDTTEVVPPAAVNDDAPHPDQEEAGGFTDDTDFTDDENAMDDVDWDIEPADVAQMIAELEAQAKQFRSSEVLSPEEAKQMEDIWNVWIEGLKDLQETEMTGQDVTDFLNRSFVGTIRLATADLAKSGACGDSANWLLDPETGLLTISGSGDMHDYAGLDTLLGLDEIGEDTDEPEEEAEGETDEPGEKEAQEPEKAGESDDADAEEEEEEAYGGMTNPLAVLTFFQEMFRFDAVQNQQEIAPWLSMFPLIQDVKVEEGVTSIGNNAFILCSLDTLTLPRSLNRLGDSALDDCSVSDIYYNGTRERFLTLSIGKENDEALDGATVHFTGRVSPSDAESANGSGKSGSKTSDSQGSDNRTTPEKREPGRSTHDTDNPATGEAAHTLPMTAMCVSLLTMTATLLAGRVRRRDESFSA